MNRAQAVTWPKLLARGGLPSAHSHLQHCQIRTHTEVHIVYTTTLACTVSNLLCTWSRVGLPISKAENGSKVQSNETAKYKRANRLEYDNLIFSANRDVFVSYAGCADTLLGVVHEMHSPANPWIRVHE